MDFYVIEDSYSSRDILTILKTETLTVYEVIDIEKLRGEDSHVYYQYIESLKKQSLISYQPYRKIKVHNILNWMSWSRYK